MKILEHISELLQTNQKENDLLAYTLLQTQMRWTIQKATWYGLKTKVKALKQIQDINYYIEDLHIKINYELDTSSGFEDWYSYYDITIDVELISPSKQLEFKNLAYVDTFKNEVDQKSIPPLAYQKKAICLIPSIQAFISEHFS